MRPGYIVAASKFLNDPGPKKALVKMIKPVNAFKRELELFFTAVSEGLEPPVDAKDGYIAQAMIDAAKQSAGLNGETIDITF